LPPSRRPVFAVDAQAQLGALCRRQQHDAHDALAVDDITGTADLDLTREAIGDVDELARCAGMQAEFVDDRDVTFEHRVSKSLFEFAMANQDVR
jgi:hypothetical protein